MVCRPRDRVNQSPIDKASLSSPPPSDRPPYVITVPQGIDPQVTNTASKFLEKRLGHTVKVAVHVLTNQSSDITIMKMELCSQILAQSICSNFCYGLVLRVVRDSYNLTAKVQHHAVYFEV
jgi:hypothetical protein